MSLPAGRRPPLQPHRHRAHRRAPRPLPRPRADARAGPPPVGDRARGPRAAHPAGPARSRLRLPDAPGRPARRARPGDHRAEPGRPAQPARPTHRPGRWPSGRSSTSAPTTSRAAVLDSLGEDEQRELTAAMRTVERLLTAGTVEVREVDPEHPDARRCLAAYVAELNARSDVPFDPATGSTAEPHEVRPPHGVFLVVYLRGTAVACGALKHHEGGVSDVKRMWVHDAARGKGIGRRLLEELERRAVEHGDTAVRLETSRHLTEAIGLYRSTGYVEVRAVQRRAVRRPLVPQGALTPARLPAWRSRGIVAACPLLNRQLLSGGESDGVRHLHRGRRHHRPHQRPHADRARAHQEHRRDRAEGRGGRPRRVRHRRAPQPAVRRAGQPAGAARAPRREDRADQALHRRPR